MSEHTSAVAQIIADAVNDELGTRSYSDGKPKRQDRAAADAIDAQYILIRRDELPEVRDSGIDSNMYYVENENVVYTSEANARMWVMRDIAVWQHVDAKESAKESAAAKRRDELSGEYFEGVYEHLPRGAYRRAIDRIIELEARKP